MANLKTILDEWEVKYLEDGLSLSISVLGCSKLGNYSNCPLT